MNKNKLIEIVKIVLENSNMVSPDIITLNENLRTDLGFDSLMLAELTVHIEDEFGIDIFEDEIVTTLNEIINKIEKV